MARQTYDNVFGFSIMAYGSVHTYNFLNMLLCSKKYTLLEKGKTKRGGGEQRIKVLRVKLSYVHLATSRILISLSDLSDPYEIINSMS